MQNEDWMKVGEDILHSVLDAVEHQDFSGLSRSIEITVNDTLGYVSEKINQKTGGQYYNTTQEWLTFAKLLDDMFEDTAWDISADISTMKTMLAKEGLTGERDFQLN